MPRQVAIGRGAVVIGIGVDEAEPSIKPACRLVGGVDLKVAHRRPLAGREREQMSAQSLAMAPAARLLGGEHVVEAGHVPFDHELPCRDDAIVFAHEHGLMRHGGARDSLGVSAPLVG